MCGVGTPAETLFTMGKGLKELQLSYSRRLRKKPQGEQKLERSNRKQNKRKTTRKTKNNQQRKVTLLRIFRWIATRFLLFASSWVWCLLLFLLVVGFCCWFVGFLLSCFLFLVWFFFPHVISGTTSLDLWVITRT